LCDGTAISRSTYADLYGVIGNIFAVSAALTTRASDSQGDLTFGYTNHGLTVGGATLKLRFYRVVNIASVNTSTDEITSSVPHTFSTAEKVRVSTTGTLPGGLSAVTDYYVRSVSGSVLTLHPTATDANNNTNKTNLTSAGTGTHTLFGQDEASRTNMGISAVSGDVVTVSGGSGSILPPANTNIFVEGDSSLFFLPDMRGRSAIGAGQGASLTNRVLGTQVGAETHTLTIAEMPAHNHGVSIAGTGSTSGWNPNGIRNPSVPFNTANTGGGGSHNNMQPSLALNFIIKT
jgi:microcystin-dependent protein